MRIVIQNDVMAVGVVIVYYIVCAALFPQLLKEWFDLPFELVRKMYHIVHTMSILLYLELFSTWQAAILALFVLMGLFYVVLGILERIALFKRLFLERKRGDFRKQIIWAQFSLVILIFIFWGLLGKDWVYVAVVAFMAWGFGDAAAALIGKAFGRRKISHPWIEGAKTLEGTLSMLIVAGLATFFTLVFYANISWYESLGVALLVAPISAVVELFSRNGSDTITVPLSAAALTFASMSLFSLFTG